MPVGPSNSGANPRPPWWYSPWSASLSVAPLLPPPLPQPPLLLLLLLPPRAVGPAPALDTAGPAPTPAAGSGARPLPPSSPRSRCLPFCLQQERRWTRRIAAYAHWLLPTRTLTQPRVPAALASTQALPRVVSRPLYTLTHPLHQCPFYYIRFIYCSASLRITQPRPHRVQCCSSSWHVRRADASSHGSIHLRAATCSATHVLSKG